MSKISAVVFAASALLALGASHAVRAADAAPDGGALASEAPAGTPSKRTMQRMLKMNRTEQPAGISSEAPPQASKRNMRKRQRDLPARPAAPGGSISSERPALANAV